MICGGCGGVTGEGGVLAGSPLESEGTVEKDAYGAQG